jgi:hypothetical protein
VIVKRKTSSKACLFQPGHLVGLLQHGEAIRLVGFVATKNASIIACQHQQGLVLFQCQVL